MKRKIVAALIIGLSLVLTGCTQVISKETTKVKGTVKSVNYDPAWEQVLNIGDTSTVITHPADYDTYIIYNDKNYCLDNADIYNYCADKVGEEVEIEISTIYYSDKAIHVRINSVGGITE
jgi:hypothetical protein